MQNIQLPVKLILVNNLQDISLNDANHGEGPTMSQVKTEEEILLSEVRNKKTKDNTTQHNYWTALDCEETCLFCLSLGVLKPIKGSRFAMESLFFQFIKSMLNNQMPKEICDLCLQKLNAISSFVSRIKDSYMFHQRFEHSYNKKTNKSKKGDGIFSEHKYAKVAEEEVQVKSVEATIEDVVKTGTTEAEIEEKNKENTELLPPVECVHCNELVHCLKDHYKASTKCKAKRGIKYTTCTICSKIFSSRYYKKHLRMHQATGEKFMCHICSKMFKYENNLKRHLNVHSQKKRFVCDLCPKAFSTNFVLQDHRNKQHLKVVKFLCSYCGKEFTSHNSWYSHEQKHRKGALILTNGRSHRKFINREIGKREPVKCPTCQRIFTSESRLKMHVGTHTESQIFRCIDCKQEFPSYNARRAHVAEHHLADYAYTCDICGKKWRDKASLKTHQKTHTDEKPYACQFCNMRSRTSGHLQCHLATIHDYNAGKPYECRYCRKSFKVRGNMLAHQKIHLRQEISPCDFCDKHFQDPRSLRRHIARMHSEVNLELELVPDEEYIFAEKLESEGLLSS